MVKRSLLLGVLLSLRDLTLHCVLEGGGVDVGKLVNAFGQLPQRRPHAIGVARRARVVDVVQVNAPARKKRTQLLEPLPSLLVTPDNNDRRSPNPPKMRQMGHPFGRSNKRPIEPLRQRRVPGRARLHFVTILDQSEDQPPNKPVHRCRSYQVSTPSSQTRQSPAGKKDRQANTAARGRRSIRTGLC